MPDIQKELFKDIKKNKNTKTLKHEEEYLGEHILHPYLGFVSIPKENYNRFCLPGIDPITQKSSKTINICLMGGSVAKELYQISKNKLIETLKKSKAFKNKEIKIVLIALGGFKQPQQLMALNYFLSLGAQYDIVINLDGFNELVLPYSDNLPFNVFSSYPRHWNIYSRKSLNSKVQLLLLKQLEIKDKQLKQNKFFTNSYLYNSNFALLLWNILNKNNKKALFNIEGQLRNAIGKSESDYQSTGPVEKVVDTTEFFTKQAALWKRTSSLIAGIAKSQGFKYFHFLQPNQYYENSKELSKKEMQIAYEHSKFSYKTAVHKGYPILINYGKKLKKEKINFFDLTLIFKNDKRTLYNDKCCHFNKLGYNLIAEKMAGKIIDHY